jgi:hypothetical protein
MNNNSASFEVEKTFSDGAEGFDPENVTAIVLKTTGNVVLKSITTKCKNTIGISNCNAEYNKELSKWIITADITNKDKVSSYNVVGSVEGSSVFSISEVNSWNDNQATFEHSHNPYGDHQGKTYSITASITQGTTITKKTSCGEKPIGKITCSDAKIDGNATIESGSEYPKFSFKLNECPNERCPYEIYLNDTKQHSDEDSGSLNYTAPGTAPECENDNGCEHTYTVKSASSDYPFDPCSATFKVVKKVEPIGLSCTDFAKLTGKETSSSISITPTVSNCDGGCTYDIKLNGNSVSDGDYSTGSISFNGDSKAGTKNYTLSMTRKNDNVTDTCNFSVEYQKPFKVTCEIEDQTDKEQGSDITVTPYSVQGCNADCYYDIKLDGSSVIGGEKGSYDGSSVSFKGANSAGEKNYTLTIYSPDKSKPEDCPFKVTYKEKESEPVCGCTCGDCSNIRTATYSNNQNGPGMYCFFIDNANVKLRMDNHTKEDNNASHCSININGTSLKKFVGTELKNLVSSTIDGGYYIYVGNDAAAQQNSDFCSFVFETNHTSSTNPCAGGSGGGTDPDPGAGGVDSYESATMGTLYSGPKNIQYETSSGTCQIEASVNHSWSEWIKQGNVFNNWGNGGQISIISPLKVSIPSGATFKITNCW